MRKIILNNHQFELLQESLKEKLEAERKEVNTDPTEKQCKAGNYAMGHISINGFEITIENPKGSYRKGKDRNGKEWKILMHNDYGYFTKTVGKDGDAIDVFLGPYIEDKELKIYPVDQYLNGEFDETKVMMGFRDKESAKKAYLSNYEKDWKGFKYITEVDVDTFKKWLYDGHRQRKPFAKYISLTESINENMVNEKFNSNKLAQYAKQHGGIEIWRNGGMRNGANAWQRGNSIDLSQVTDDMLNGEPVNYDSMENKDNAILFNDGTAVQLKPYNEIPAPEKKKKPSRYMTGIGDTGDHNKKPPFNNPDAKIQKQEYNPWGISQKAAEAHYGREAIQNNKNDIDYVNSHKEDYPNWRELTYDANKNIQDIKNRVMKKLDEARKNNPPKDEFAAINKANREDDIEAHGKPTAFRGNITKNPKAYTRKEKHKQNLEDCDESCGKKIYVTESQFKNYCRILLQEKRKTDYIKNLLK